MAQINFYTLSSEDPVARLQFACRLAEKACSLGHQVYIETESAEQARAVDDLLWQFKAASFVPHRLAGSDIDKNIDNNVESVVIGSNAADSSHDDVFINLGNTACEAHQKFSRINEIVGVDKQSLEQGRIRYRYYKGLGYQPETHKL